MTRDEILAPVIDVIQGGTGLSARRIAQELVGWEVVPAYFDGQHVGTAILRGTEIHFALRAEFRRRVIRRSNTQEFLAPLLERLGFLTTRLQPDQVVERKFIERVGFKPTWTDGRFQYFLLGRLPFERKRK